MAEGRDLKDAIRFASAAATLSVLKYGVIESMPHRAEVEKEQEISPVVATYFG